ncbi:MAG: hypothetical protein ACC682_03550 [Gemmatimonadota bacterium]
MSTQAQHAERSRALPRPFGRPDLRELLEDRPGPAISIYLRSEGPAPDPKRDRLELRAALKRAGELLAGSSAADSADELLAPLHALLQDTRGWPPGETTAVFRAPDFLRLYQLSGDVQPMVVVGPTFHTRPLIRHLQSPEGFWVLELGQGAVRLWRGSARGVILVEPNPLPADMDSSLGYEGERDAQFLRRTAGGRGRRSSRLAQGGGSTGAFSAHGVGEDDRDPALRKFFGAVDIALSAYIGPEHDPVILAAVGEHHPRYRAVTTLSGLTEHGIEASIHSWSADRIHEASWPIAVQATKRQLAANLTLWERACTHGKGETDLASLAALAVAGRIRVLLIERGRRIWGTIQRDTGEIDVLQLGGDDPASDAVELLDEISEIVVLHGGSTFVLDGEEMPTQTGVAGILR